MAAPSSMTYALAVSPQVIYQGSSIINLVLNRYADVQEAPEAASSRLHQIRQLVQASKFVRQSPVLQTDELVAALRACYGKARAIYSELEKSLLEVEDSRSPADTIQGHELNLFNDLEREQFKLILCLQALQPNILADVEKELSIEDVETTSKKLSSSTISDKPIDIHNTVIPDLIQKLQVRPETAGREDILEQLVQALPILEASSPRITIVQGIMGQGKTQLALEFCHRALEKSLVAAAFWVDASCETNVEKCFGYFYEKINGNQRDFIEPEAKVEFVLNKLSSLKAPWLLVFDNYDDPATFKNVRDYFPIYGQAARLADEGSFIELGGLNPTDGIALLLKHCQIAPTETANQEASVIAEKLWHHALTITQAGTYISSRGIQSTEFLNKFDSRKELIRQGGPDIVQYRGKLNAAEKDTSLNVFATWELSFQQLEAQDRNGSMASLLTLLAFFNCKDISERLLQGYCRSRRLTGFDLEVLGGCAVTRPGKNAEACSAGNQDAGDERDHQGENDGIVHVWNSSAFGDVLKALRQLSLIQTLDISDDEYHHVAIHPLVSEWIKIRIKNPQVKFKHLLLSIKILQCMVEDISSLKDEEEAYSRTFSARQIVSANLDTVWQNLEGFFDNQDLEISPYDRVIIEAFGDFADFLYNTGKFHQALPWQRLTTRLWIVLDGKGSYNALDSSNELAYALVQVGEFDEAARIAKEVISLAGESSGKHIILAARDALATCLLYQHQFSSAEALYRDSLSNGATIPTSSMGTLLNNLGFVLYKQGRHEESEAFRRRASGYQLRCYGRYHHLSIEADNNYVMSLQALGRDVEAEELAIDVLERAQAVLGREHPMAFEVVDTLGQVLLAQGRYDDAAALCGRVLAWRVGNFGTGHHKTRESKEVMEKIEAARRGLRSRL